MMRQYVETAVQPWCVKFADAMRTKLLPSGLRFAFDHHALMRGNLRDTASALKDLSSTGAVTINDAREMLGLPEDLTGGDQPIQPSVVARE
jgi:phage portal protein BeeE